MKTTPRRGIAARAPAGRRNAQNVRIRVRSRPLRLTRAPTSRPTAEAFVHDRPVDLAALVAQWYVAFQAAEAALRAAGRDLPADELRARRQRLSQERASTATALQALARESRASGCERAA